MKKMLLILMVLASWANAQDFNTELPRLYFKVGEAEAALFTDLKNLNADKWGETIVPDEAHLAKIHQDEKLLDEAVEELQKANN
jgi:hypothetical protein